MKINNVSTTQRIALVFMCLVNMDYAAEKKQSAKKEFDNSSAPKVEKNDQKNKPVFSVIRHPHIDKKSGRFLSRTI